MTTTVFPSGMNPFTPDDNTVFLASPGASASSYGVVQMSYFRQALYNAGVLHNQVGYNGTLSVAPTANPSLATKSGFSVQGTTNQGTGSREFMANFGQTVTQGAGGSAGVADKVTLYTGADIYSGAGDSWAQNICLTVNGGAGVQSVFGMELDFNNENRDTSQDFAHAHWPFAITGASSQMNTAAMLITESNARFQRGIEIFAGIADAGIEDRSSPTMLRALGSKTLGIDFTNLSFGSGAMALRIGNTNGIYWTNVAQSQAAADYVDGAFNRIVGSGATAVIFGGSSNLPLTDNHASSGGGFARWSQVYSASGTVSSSDLNDKIDVEPLPSMLDFVDALQPIKYRWASGGQEEVEETEMREVQETKPAVHQVPAHEMRDGKMVYVMRDETHEVPVWDEHPLHDKETGEPMFVERPVGEMKTIDGRPVFVPTLDESGQPKMRQVPLMHRTPRMVMKPFPVKKYVHREGKRTHYGLGAQHVKAAADKHLGGDFGAHVVAPNGHEMLRYEQFQPVMIRHGQEMRTISRTHAQEIADLKAQIAAITARLDPPKA